MVRCHYNNLFLNEYDYDSTGITFRDTSETLQVIYYMYGRLVVSYIRERILIYIIIRSLTNPFKNYKTNSLFSSVQKTDYATFLSQPYFSEVALRNLEFPVNDKEATKKFFRESKEFFDEIIPEG